MARTAYKTHRDYLGLPGAPVEWPISTRWPSTNRTAAALCESTVHAAP
jgi:hypothetical protein